MYSFAINDWDNNVIKRMYVDQLTQNRISSGKLAIVKFQGGYEIVPVQVADKISQRDENAVVYRADTLVEEQSSEEDDWYADYQIPDDLSW